MPLGKTLNMTRRLFQKAPRYVAGQSAGRAWAGRTTLASGSASVTVSTAVINSDSLVLYGTQVSSVGVGVNSIGGVVVNSIVSGVSLAFARETGVGAPWDATVMWEICKRS